MEKIKHKTLTQHKPEKARSKAIFMYSDQGTVKARSTQESGNCKMTGGREESAGPPYGKTTNSPAVSGRVLFREERNLTVQLCLKNAGIQGGRH